MSDTPKPSIAVALKYENGSAPRVIASGRGFVSEKIVEVAQQHGVPLQKNPALASALSTLQLEDEIPENLYKAVAQVLGFILKAAGQLK
ncbi:MAG: EscU/YscU/HrcU family type III secretion system export apparatus switch protein [Micropepsaceae bacterium]